MANAKVRVRKLERAMEAVGVSDPTYTALADALKRAREPTQAHPVADRITATESFIERARKRVEKERKEVDRAKAEFAKAEAQLVLEREAVREGEFVSTLSNKNPMEQNPIDFARELAQLRTMVQDLMQERDQLKSQLGGQGSTPCEEGRPRARSLASPSPDVMMPISNQLAVEDSRDPSRLMDPLIDRTDSAARSSWAEQMVA